MTNKIYVLWILQTDSLGHHTKVTINKVEKEYPSSNLHCHGQYNSLEEIRNLDDVVTDCKVCGNQIDEETRIYTDTIPPTCTTCKRKDEVTKAL